MPQELSGGSFPDAVLHLWEYENAPASLRRLVPSAYAGGWLAFICPGGAAEIVEGLMRRADSSAFPVVRYKFEDGGIVLAGPHPSDLGSY